MTSLTRIAVVSGSRADWSLLQPIVEGINTHPKLELQLWISGSHLEERFGHTIDHILEQGYEIHTRIPLELQTDQALDTCKALANSINGFAQAIDDRKPDILLILGDRYEIFGAAQAALLAGIPIAHIAGGDISEGAYDDAMRHAITKLSHLHFVTNSEAKSRLIQMGENFDNIILSGSPGIDAILNTPRLSRTDLEATLNWHFREQNIAISFHPATRDDLSPQQQVEELVKALKHLSSEIGIILSGSNADTGGDLVNNALKSFSRQHDHCCFIQSLGQQRYYSVIAEVDLLVGNSSSGLYEAPSLKTATLNIGNRQRGRLQGNSITNCTNQHTAITTMIENCLKTPLTEFHNPYGDGSATEIIVKTLAQYETPQELLNKSFTDRDCVELP